ncbi:MAG: aminopeptidase P family protein [Aestuariivirga sp.]|uniref:aminopeptidase P family protein n=1 Tax=Aestuariivirga sp. TaxID=2650926 RepID=UPI0025C41DD3|nr:aminopeptidase P family protein [Aestuariivirga sp.]MCA3560408.1 aminopeptidase P family protein [Aestuariivirga sp.]
MTETHKTRLALLRAEVKRRKLTGFFVPRADEFQGEYVPAHAERLRWLTNFRGSAGIAIVTLKKAAIFVDGRYVIQVRQQVDEKIFAPFHLMEEPPSQWIGKNLKKGDKLGFDPWLVTAEQATRLAEACAAVGASFVPVESNPIDAVWADQPPRPTAALATQPTQFAGRTAAEKIKDLRKGLDKVDAVVLTQPDSVAWLFNLRGFDVPHSPVVAAYAILPAKGKAQLFIAKAKLPEDVRQHLKSTATTHEPSEIGAALKALGKARARVLIDPAWTPERIRALLEKAKATVATGADPVSLPKARKNVTEQEGARAAQKRDGVAVSRFLCWLDKEAPNGGLTELDVAAKLAAFRAGTGELKDLSFETIPASGPHAAIPHYHATEESNRKLGRDEIFLIDSGAQYIDGTTDITRTVIVGTPTAEMKDRFTRVLKGMVGLSMIRFPKGTTGSQIDILARQHLWSAGLDFDHGTGHGVGAYLSVHEGPARINKSDRTPLEPGMILSNEPGFYKQGGYGIRIENLVMVHEAKPVAGGERPMLGFETLTLAPIDRRLIDVGLLSEVERQWLDAYHARVLKEVGDFLAGEELVWLRKSCAPLG